MFVPLHAFAHLSSFTDSSPADARIDCAMEMTIARPGVAPGLACQGSLWCKVIRVSRLGVEFTWDGYPPIHKHGSGKWPLGRLFTKLYFNESECVRSPLLIPHLPGEGCYVDSIRALLLFFSSSPLYLTTAPQLPSSRSQRAPPDLAR